MTARRMSLGDATDGGPTSRAIDWAVRTWMRRAFHRFLVRSKTTGKRPVRGGEPALYVSNHCSFWDGFVVRHLAKLDSDQSPHFSVMLRSQTSQFPFLKRIGGFGIVPGDLHSLRDTIRSFQELRRLVTNRDGSREPATPRDRANVTVALFPQGSIWPSHREPLGFQHGWSLVSKTLGGPSVIPVGIHIEPHNHVKPTGYALVGEPVSFPNAGKRDTRRLEAVVESLVSEIRELLSHWGEDAPRAWATLGATSLFHADKRTTS